MAIETFPELATNLIYTVLCLVPGFITVKTAAFFGEGEVDVDSFDRSMWALVASGLSLSVLYFLFVAWHAITTGDVALVVPLDLQWTELVAAYPLLVGVSAGIGYVASRLIARAGSHDVVSGAGRERSAK